MPIIITNTGGPPAGVCKYQLRLNDDLISEFEHDRCKGLSECLRSAAESVDKAKWEQLDKILKLFGG